MTSDNGTGPLNKRNMGREAFEVLEKSNEDGTVVRIPGSYLRFPDCKHYGIWFGQSQITGNCPHCQMLQRMDKLGLKLKLSDITPGTAKQISFARDMRASALSEAADLFSIYAPRALAQIVFWIEKTATSWAVWWINIRKARLETVLSKALPKWHAREVGYSQGPSAFRGRWFSLHQEIAQLRSQVQPLTDIQKKDLIRHVNQLIALTTGTEVGKEDEELGNKIKAQFSILSSEADLISEVHPTEISSAPVPSERKQESVKPEKVDDKRKVEEPTRIMPLRPPSVLDVPFVREGERSSRESKQVVQKTSLKEVLSEDPREKKLSNVKLTDVQIAELRKLLLKEGVSSYKELDELVQTKFGVTYSSGGLQGLLFRCGFVGRLDVLQQVRKKDQSDLLQKEKSPKVRVEQRPFSETPPEGAVSLSTPTPDQKIEEASELIPIVDSKPVVVSSEEKIVPSQLSLSRDSTETSAKVESSPVSEVLIERKGRDLPKLPLLVGGTSEENAHAKNLRKTAIVEIQKLFQTDSGFESLIHKVLHWMALPMNRFAWWWSTHEEDSVGAIFDHVLPLFRKKEKAQSDFSGPAFRKTWLDRRKAISEYIQNPSDSGLKRFNLLSKDLLEISEGTELETVDRQLIDRMLTVVVNATAPLPISPVPTEVVCSVPEVVSTLETKESPGTSHESSVLPAEVRIEVKVEPVEEKKPDQVKNIPELPVSEIDSVQSVEPSIVEPLFTVNERVQLRVVNLCEHVSKEHPVARLWAFGLEDLVALYGISRQEVMRLIRTEKVDPSDLVSIYKYQKLIEESHSKEKIEPKIEVEKVETSKEDVEEKEAEEPKPWKGPLLRQESKEPKEKPKAKSKVVEAKKKKKAPVSSKPFKKPYFARISKSKLRDFGKKGAKARWAK